MQNVNVQCANYVRVRFSFSGLIQTLRVDWRLTSVICGEVRDSIDED
jgi:hypothetical protein